MRRQDGGIHAASFVSPSEVKRFVDFVPLDAAFLSFSLHVGWLLAAAFHRAAEWA
jgi:hypothetical protein